MTQLYVGNLSADGDEKAIRNLFSKYGVVREVLMKNGYSFVEFEHANSADEAMRALNGSDILGHPMIVEPSHQQRVSKRKAQFGRVEVSSIPHNMTNLQSLESLLSSAGAVLKVEIEEGEIGSRVIVTFETQEQAQRAAAMWPGDDITSPRITLLEDKRSPTVTGIRNNRKASPTSPTKTNSDFPLRIMVPSDMVGAIIGKDGATIRGITQLTKARVDVHRRENLGSAEKAITIIGPPECCTEACYQIMKIMQNELLMTSGMLDVNKHYEQCPVVPLKILAHNELVGRVIGKGGNTLKRIMAESGTKITISKLKELSTYNMERTITILGTIDNYKKAESLISSKLRASYESDMAQFIPEQNHVFGSSSLNGSSTPSLSSGTSSVDVSALSFLPRTLHSQSLPPTPTAIRTFTDLNGDHTRLTTLQGSNSALEVNSLGGFPSKMAHNGSMPGTTNGFKFPSNAFESGYEYMKVNGTNGTNGYYANGGGHDYGNHGLITTVKPMANHEYLDDDDISGVFSGLSLSKEPFLATPGYGRARPRRSSAPVTDLWSDGYENDMGFCGNLGRALSSNALSSGSWNGMSSHVVPENNQSSVSNIWGSRPESELSSYSGSDQGISPVYSPVSNGTFDHVPTITTASYTIPPVMSSADTEARSTHKHMRPPQIMEEDEYYFDTTAMSLQLIGDEGPEMVKW